MHTSTGTTIVWINVESGYRQHNEYYHNVNNVRMWGLKKMLLSVANTKLLGLLYVRCTIIIIMYKEVLGVH